MQVFGIDKDNNHKQVYLCSHTFEPSYQYNQCEVIFLLLLHELGILEATIRSKFYQYTTYLLEDLHPLTWS